MKKIYLLNLFMLTVSLSQAQEVGLDDLIGNISANNRTYKSYDYQAMSKERELESQQRSFFPTIDLGATYQNNDPYNTFSPKESKSVYGTVGLDIFDGGKKLSLVRSKRYEYQASLYEKEAFLKSLTLDIVQRYFLIEKLQSNLLVAQMQSNELQYQIKRASSFLKAGLMTQDDVDKFQASYDENEYNIQNIIYSIDEQKEYIQNQTGLNCDILKESMLSEPDTDMKFDDIEKTKILDLRSKSTKEIANSVISAYIPQIRVQDTYTRYYYDSDVLSDPASSDFLFEKKNVLSLSASWRIFDGGQISKQKEAYNLQSLALQEQKLDSEKEQKSSFELAKKRLKTLRSQIKSAASALKSAQSTHEIITKKFEAGLVDNIAYLDALNANSAAMSRYKSALYDYEIAKSLFYYFAGKNPKEFIR